MSNEPQDVRKELEELKVAQAAQAAAFTGAQATQAAITAGTTATQAAATAGTLSTMVAGSVALVVGLFLGLAVRSRTA